MDNIDKDNDELINEELNYELVEDLSIDNEIDKIKSVEVSDTMEDSFMKYSMSVIISRALPDVRDGLKPVHRRIIYAMDELNARPNTPHKKCARITGDTMGKYHPHGDSSIYDAMVRMAQDFSYRYPLVDGHGNFGSIDGDGAAASRYTEARMSKFAIEMMRDINKNTVDFGDNYTNEFKEPLVLPSRFPNILVNGTMGIAVGMATNIPPHNLSEIIDGCVSYIDNPDIEVSELMQNIKGPDFPTGASILGNGGIKRAYETGKGSITIRSKTNIEEKNGKTRIVITELPYQVNKKNLITKIAELVKAKAIDGIADLVDETNLNGIKIVIDIKKEANANVVLNNLFKQTALQTSFGINLLALVNGEPKILSLKDILYNYLNHQKEVIIRRTQFDLEKSEKRAHILDGLKIALDHIDAIIKLIRSSKEDAQAKEGLMNQFNLSDPQAEAILEMKLRRLTALEIEKIEAELAELLKLIQELKEILASEEKVLSIIKDELLEIKQRYGDERRTEIDMTAIEYIEDESLIPVENIIITLTNKGYIKRCTSDTYKTQNRGGVGVKGMATNEEDFVEHMINLSTHDYVMLFSNKGKAYRLKGYEIPEFSRQSKGLPIVNLLQIEKDEMINSIIKVSENEKIESLLFVTKKGLTKKTGIKEFENIRANGKICITLKEGDELISVKKTDGSKFVLLASKIGRMVKFAESEIRKMGRTASGVRGIKLSESDYCIGADVASDDDVVLIITENGYGKKTKIAEFRTTKRGSKGVKALNITDRNGNLVAFKIIESKKDVMIITDSGMIIRMPGDQISLLGRVTQGVRLINLKNKQYVSTVSVVDQNEDELIDPVE